MPNDDKYITIPLWFFILFLLTLSTLFTGFFYFLYTTDPLIVYSIIEDILSNPLPFIGVLALIVGLAELGRVVWRAWNESNIVLLEDKDVASASTSAEDDRSTEIEANEADEKAESETDVFLEKYRVKEPQKIEIPIVNVDENDNS